jgi:hypothetical protein
LAWNLTGKASLGKKDLLRAYFSPMFEPFTDAT